jgi:carbonic anhydrase
MSGGEAATIEFAVAGLKIRDIIICGHSHCGAMAATISDPGVLADMPAMRSWLTHAEATRRIIQDKYQHLQGQARLIACVEENVLVQLESLRTHPVVAAGLAAKTLTLHGWVYKFETGEVFAYDPAEEQFLPLCERRRPKPVTSSERSSINPS